MLQDFITPENKRCSPYYAFASNIEDPLERWFIKKKFPELDLEQIYIPRIRKQFHFGLFTAILTTQAVFGLLVCLWLVYNAYKFGYKQRRFCTSYLVLAFYVFSTLFMMTTMYLTISILHLTFDSNDYFVKSDLDTDREGKMSFYWSTGICLVKNSVEICSAREHDYPY